MKWNSNNRKQK